MSTSYGFNLNETEGNAPPSYQEAYSTSFQAPGHITKEEYFRQIIEKYEISRTYADKLQVLQGFKIVFVFDDSGSMKTVLDDSPLNKNNTLMKAKRWDELQYFANISIEIASLFDSNGCDVYFLNKGLVRNVAHSSQLASYFASGPGGYTPLTNTFNSVLSNNIEAIKEKKLLVLIVTDGEPTNTSGDVDVKAFKKCLLNRNPIEKIFVTIVACTDDDTSIDYMNKWDRDIKNLDVVDDFRNERLQIRKIKGNNVNFSYGDYVVKSLIGSIDPSLDKQDEKNAEKCIIV